MDECRDKHNDLCHAIERKVQLRIGTVEANLESIREATRIQTAELDRRLDILNGHQAELKSFQENFVRRDTYDDKIKAHDEWMDKAGLDIGKLMTDYENKISRAHWIGIVAILVSIGSILFSMR